MIWIRFGNAEGNTSAILDHLYLELWHERNFYFRITKYSIFHYTNLAIIHKALHYKHTNPFKVCTQSKYFFQKNVFPI